jgi:hypothetical protein
MTALRVRRLAVTALVAGLIAAAEALATLSPEAPHTQRASHLRTAHEHRPSPPHGGEPQPSQDSSAPHGAWIAAVRFVRDYAAWQAGKLARLPSRYATERVIRLLKRTGRQGIGAIAGLTSAVRIAVVGRHRYLATSAVGNFLIGRRKSWWLVTSLPGD